MNPMTPIDSRKPPKSLRNETSICTIGGGIAGIPIAREFIEDREPLTRLQELVAERLATAGIGRLDNNELKATAPSYTDASPHMGTMRISEDPKRGVVDR